MRKIFSKYDIMKNTDTKQITVKKELETQSHEKQNTEYKFAFKCSASTFKIYNCTTI